MHTFHEWLDFQVLAFSFSWLILAEASTVWMGIRWLLINTGRGDSTAMHIANACFGATSWWL